ncbi:cysteine-rich receptor-like protein kinase 10 isoform X6 [Malus domestica]|uniref:cysteine-rich receptor-like protein kinase 10 isoform X6 n=1 Tax=Malus domestica TaxID=3750 RepID=UPI00397675D5
MPAMDSSRFLFCLFPILFLMINQALGQNCIDGKGNYTTNSTYQTNLNRLLSSLPSDENGNGYGFYNASYRLNSSNEHIYAIGLCRGDVTVGDCRSCLNNSRYDLLQRCPNQKEAFGSYEKCNLRYSNRSIYGVMETEPSRPSPYYWNINNISSSELDGFNQELEKLLDSIRREAAAGGSLRKFAFGNTSAPTFQTIFALAQCTPDISEQNCSDCLVGAFAYSSNFYGKVGGGVNKPSCYFRFDLYPFYDPTTVKQLPSPPPIHSPPPSTNTTNTSQGLKNGKSRTVIIIVVPIIASLVLAMFMGICLRVRNAKKMFQSNLIPGEDMDEIGSAESLQFNFDTIRIAADDFSEANKLGQGGFGSVYKGMLISGQEIAVKRLSKSSGQGVQEFKNEVVLVAKLQHRNLVRLLGFCLEGEETILVYEYVPNKSLDYFLFEHKKREQLDWLSRTMIIGGIARGILYLHEDSRLRVIHRDLKASNILLDSNMNPKISDFGMARMFGIDDQTEGNTKRIVGTYGYMVPEYAMEGLYSVKSDVFSFGVLLLEIITGRRNFLGFHRTNCKPTLIGYAWQLWNETKGLELMDPLLKDSCSPNEFLRYIHIGLLCVQEDANNRPTMSSVVLMLKSETIILPRPEKPAFFTGGYVDHHDQVRPQDCSGNGLTISIDVPR